MSIKAKKILLGLLSLMCFGFFAFAITSCGDHVHEWNNGEVTQEATCIKEGQITYTCTSCEEVKVETITALGHKEVVDEAVEPTCTTTGLTEGKHCSECNEVLVAQEVIDVIGHNYLEQVVTEATCLSDGVTLFTCSNCNDTKYEVIKTTGHKVVKDAAVAATCTEAGLTEGKHCSTCNKVLIEQKVVSAKGHKEVVDKAVAATCTTTGLTEGSHCDICLQTLVKQTVVSALGHDYLSIEGEMVSCEEPIQVTNICTRCNHTYYSYKLYPFIGHDFVDGYCSKCNQKYYTKGLEYELSSDRTYYSIIGIGEAVDTNIVIPSTYNGLPVTSIGYGAFADCNSLESITIPDSVTSIGKCAFEGCSSLTNIKIPDGVTSIGERAFGCCYLLNKIEIPSSVTIIDDDAFIYCYSLEKIEVNNKNIYYDSRNDCNAIIETATNTIIVGCKNTVIPSSITIIGGSAFSSCDSLESIIIPDSVIKIGGWAFGECSSLTNITIPDSVTSIGKYAFFGCSSLESIIIPKSITSIEEATFAGCRLLQNITIPDSVTSIGIGAFAYCNSLKSITIPSSVTYIEHQVFQGCISLERIKVDNENKFYDSRDNCNAIIETANNRVIAGCKNTIIPSSVTSIGSRSFIYCSSLKSITIPNSVTSIESLAFYGCDSLSYVYFIGTKEQWNDITMHNMDSELLNAKIIFTNEENYVENFEFEISSDGTYYSVIGIGTVLDKQIKIPNMYKDLPVTRISDYAFYNCDFIKSISIPSSVTSIGYKAFFGCTSLESIDVANNNKYYDSREGCNALIETLTNKLIVGCKNTIIPDGVECIEAYAFYGCSSLTNIKIPDGVTRLGESAFEECTFLESIIIPNSLISIGDYNFYGCYFLKTIYYKGTEEEYNNIDINYDLYDIDKLKSRIYFNYKE